MSGIAWLKTRSDRCCREGEEPRPNYRLSSAQCLESYARRLPNASVLPR